MGQSAGVPPPGDPGAEIPSLSPGAWTGSHDAREPGRPAPESRRLTGLRVGLVFGAIFALAQGAILLSRVTSAEGAVVLYFGSAAATLAVVLLAIRLEHRTLRDYGFVLRGPVTTTLVLSTVLVVIFVVVEVYPGFLIGFGRLPQPSALAFGLVLFSAPLVALAQESAFRGYIFRKLTRVAPLTWAMGASSALFALQTTNLATLASLGEVGVGEYVFGTTIANAVLGLVLALYFYKLRWSLLGPVTARTGLLWASTLLPVAANYANWEASFAALFLAYGILFGFVALGLREPRIQARHYLGGPIGPRRLRYRTRVQNRRQVRDGILTLGMIALVGVGSTQLVPVVLGTPSPLLAIASGSMVPTLYRGDLVVVERVDPSTITVGTIIAFHVSCLPAPTVHRVYRILHVGGTEYFETKGDHNLVPDPCHASAADVIGKVVATVPYAGFFVLDPLLSVGLVACIVAVGLLVRPKPRSRRR